MRKFYQKVEPNLVEFAQKLVILLMSKPPTHVYVSCNFCGANCAATALAAKKKATVPQPPPQSQQVKIIKPYELFNILYCWFDFLAIRICR